MSDAIKKPAHYNQGPIECIDAMKIVLTPEEFRGYLKGNVFKYLWREKDKNGIEDLRKGKDYYDRLIQLFDESEQKQHAWTPKIGDWVRINKPSSDKRDSVLWSNFMDGHDKEVVQVKKIEHGAILHGEWFFPFDWLEPADQPKASLSSDKIPESYRKLNDSSEEPRQLGDLRWSVSEKRYIEITGDEIGYANRDNWAACRKIEPAIKQSLKTEPPDGWRWLEVGEVIRKGDLPCNDGLVYATEPIMLGMALQEHWKPMIRRNKFEVGEKVVWIKDDTVWTYMSEINDGPDFPKSAWVKCDNTSLRACVNKLAPYIEEQS